MKRHYYLISLLLFSINAFAVSNSPYLGQQHRAIKALSVEQVNGYLTGKGMGYAKSAELNHYPGPRHVLELARELGLSDEQIKQTEKLFKSMKKSAILYGQQIIALESQLDKRFASGAITAGEMEILLDKIGRTESRLRNIHLSAHLKQVAILKPAQIKLYDRLRGYQSGNNHSQHHHNH